MDVEEVSDMTQMQAAVGAGTNPDREIVLQDSGKERRVLWSEVLAAAKRIAEFFRAVQARFVERDDLIRILKYAFLLREHVLLFGKPGTAKTAIADTIMRNIDGARAWSSDLSQFMAETRIFGDFDVRRAQETGQLVHRPEGSILEAHFANLGEFLDGNTALLRSLLRVLNEREFVRGPQHLNVPLMTALANTNTDPTAARERTPELEAVLDRFLFWHCVDYVREPANRIRMLRMFLGGQHDQPLPKLSITDVELVSTVVLRTSLLRNEFILFAYEELARKFAELRGRQISDRRLNKGIQILDASAILDGTEEVDWDDLDRVALIFVDHPDDGEKFTRTLGEVKEKWRNEQTQAQVNTESLALDALAGRAPTASVDQATDAELVAMKRDLLRLKGEVEAFTVSSTGGAARRTEVLTDINRRTEAVQRRIDGV